MILNKYREIMEKVTVTPQMQERILKNIQQQEWELQKKSPLRLLFRRLAPIAACFAILLIGAVSLPLLRPANLPQNPTDGDVLGAPVMEQVQNAKELSARLGFDMTDLSTLKNQAAEVRYMAYSDMGEINYSWAAQTVCYRKSVGSGDNSGDYEDYRTVREIAVGGMTVTVKGNGTDTDGAGGISLAVWNDGKNSFSLRFESAVSQELLITCIKETQ